MITEDGKVGVNCVKNQPCNIFVFHAWLASTTSLHCFSKVSQGIWVSQGRNQNRCIILNKLCRLPTVLELSIRKDQSNSRIVFIFVTCREKDYYHFVSVGQFSLDCCSYCEPRRRMQGGCNKHYFLEFPDFSFKTLRIHWPR